MADYNKLTRDNLAKVDFAGIAIKMIECTAAEEEIVSFRNDHITRVQAIAMGLAKGYDSIDIHKLMIACQIHDMHKYVAVREDHGHLTADFMLSIVDQWDMSSEERKEWKKVIHAVKFHSGAENMAEKCKKNPYLAILYDADKLDKLSVEYIKKYKELFFAEKSMLDTIKHKCTNVCIGYGFSKNYASVKEHMLKEMLKMLDESDRLAFINHISAQFAEKSTKNDLFKKDKSNKKKKKKK